MKKTIISLIVAVIALVVSVSAYLTYDDEIPLGELTVHFIDVGQGDACVVELPDSRKMLIDAGESSAKEELNDYISSHIKDKSGRKITYFDIVIMTHSDSDHIGGMAYILERYHAKTLYRPNQECTYKDCHDEANDLGGKNGFWGDDPLGTKSTATYHNALEAAYKYADEVIVTNPHDDEQNTITSTGEIEYEINFYSPISSYYEDNNNYSPIIVIEYKGRKVVVSGDAEKENEAEFVAAVREGKGRYAKLENFNADVIKLGHHGSRTSSSEDYLGVMTQPLYRSNTFVVISCGAGNSYGHPHSEVLTRLSSMGFSDSKVLRTDLLGDIVITIALVNGEYRATVVENAGYGDALRIAVITSAVAVGALILLVIMKAGKKKKRKKRCQKAKRNF